MATFDDGRAGFLGGIRRWFRLRLVGDVPGDVARCEFECRQHECLHGQWEACENRLRDGSPAT